MAHSDRPPHGDEAAIFTYTRANEYDEHWVAIDLPTAQKVGDRILRAITDLQALPLLP